MIDLPEAKTQLTALEPHLIAAHHDAMAAWVDIVKTKPEFALPLDPTARACILNDHICAGIAPRVIDLAAVSVNDRLGFFALAVGTDILLRFKYVGHGVPMNVQTRQQALLAKQSYNEQMVLALAAGDPDVAATLVPPTMLTCGYTIDGAEIGRIEIRRDCEGHPTWSYDVFGGDAVIAPQPLPGQDDTAKPARITRKIAAQGEDAATANGAS